MIAIVTQCCFKLKIIWFWNATRDWPAISGMPHDVFPLAHVLRGIELDVFLPVLFRRTLFRSEPPRWTAARHSPLLRGEEAGIRGQDTGFIVWVASRSLSLALVGWPYPHGTCGKFRFISRECPLGMPLWALTWSPPWHPLQPRCGPGSLPRRAWGRGAAYERPISVSLLRRASQPPDYCPCPTQVLRAWIRLQGSPHCHPACVPHLADGPRAAKWRNSAFQTPTANCALHTFLWFCFPHRIF